MNQYLLLILLTSWSLVITHLEACDTGVAFSNSVLSVSRSSLANADVALLESYTAHTVEKCMEDCCSGKYGDCTVASFNKNATKKNCLLFNCRPLKQCKFLSSKTTDSFTFSSGTRPIVSRPVPSVPAYSNSTPISFETTTTAGTTSPRTTSPKAKSHLEQPHAVEEIATFSDEQADLKNDNTSVKPRKGVTAFTPDAMLFKSGIKPRKGVTLEDVPHSKLLLKGLNKSNVKARKGVEINDMTEGVYNFYNITSISNNGTRTASFNSTDISDSELVSELERILEDDPLATSTDSQISSATKSTLDIISPSSSVKIFSTATVDGVSSFKMNPSLTNTPVVSSSSLIESSFSITPSLVESSTFSVEATSSAVRNDSYVVITASTAPLLSAKAYLSMDEPKSLDKSLDVDSKESESDRKYKSSIHVVLSLVFGLVVLFAVLGVVAKRMYDSWQRRDYYRMNYLIDGVYNGYN